jgi:hypothetical protein
MAASVSCSCLIGCGDKSAIHQQVRDPLLISKKPVEGRAERPAPTPVAYAAPLPPAPPETALASAPVKLQAIGVNGTERAETAPVLTATPAIRTNPAVTSGETVSRREPAKIYGHAPDHAWLQGVIDKHYQGHLSLRYCDPSEDDEWGGKVVLEEDPRLSEFKDGDVVRVEGEIVREDGKVKRGVWNHFAHYRFKDIRLIQSK